MHILHMPMFKIGNTTVNHSSLVIISKVNLSLTIEILCVERGICPIAKSTTNELFQ